MFTAFNTNSKHRRILKRIFSLLYIVFSFCVLDLWLRFQTRWIGEYSIFEPAPNLFTFLWSFLFTILISIIPSQKISKIVYGMVYFLFTIYAVVQYGAYLILGRFLYISDFMLIGEGSDYTTWVISVINPSIVPQILALVIIGVIGILVIPQTASSHNSDRCVCFVVAAFCVLCIIFVPTLYDDTSDEGNFFANPALEYKRFINANFGLELTGLYQFPVRDIQIRLEKALKNYDEEIQMIDAFFAGKASHSANEMTGIFEGKNVIVVMMESMDDWLITSEDTPVIYKMMTDGINFTNMYTPAYSSGYTFNTEFAFNTAIYPYTNGNAAYTLTRNSFDCSIANSFADAGYSANSFHEGRTEYYNRGQIHVALGYSKYHSYQNYPSINIDVLDDRFLTESDELYSDLTKARPFFSFVITYSPHLPYTDEESLSQTALSLYPQYNVQEDREVGILRAKARLTDDMFAGLLNRLEEDNLLDDTVIIGFADHYAYGLTDTTLLQQLSEEAGTSILENTPAFIYCADDVSPMVVDKVMQTTDLAPTIMNLFGIEVPKEIMGYDVFDDDYSGCAIFPNGTWLTNTAYVKKGNTVWNDGMSAEELSEMNSYVQQVYKINDAILDSDYYRQH